MLVLDSATGCYDAEAAPETGSDLLFDYHRQLIVGEEMVELGEHAVY